LGTSFAIFKRDLRKILRNPIALAITLGICIVPCLYAWINILANWDPYSNTSGMPVAVVNEDRPVTLEEQGEICAGDLMVEALKENDAIGWQFMDEEEALEGVQAGTYYAAIVIPEDFTTNLTGILDGRTDKAQLKYYVNEKVNAIAPKVTDTGATTIETQIKGKFTATAGEVITEKLGDALTTMVDDSHTAVGRAVTALGDVQTALKDVDTQLGSVSDSLTSAQSALMSAADDLTTLQGEGERLANRLKSSLDEVARVRTNANQLMTDINTALGNASGGISTVSSRASADVSALAGDVSSAQSQIKAAIVALENDLTDSEGLKASISDAIEFVARINPTDESAITMRADLQRQLENELTLVVQLSDSQQAKLDELRALSAELEAVTSEVTALSDTINARAQAAATALSGAQTGAIGTSLSQISSAIDTFVRVGQQLETSSRSVDPLVGEAVQVTRDLANTMSTTASALGGTRSSLTDLAKDVEGLSGELTTIQASDAWALMKSLTDANPEGVKEFLASPVGINKNRLFPVENYASGVAPFFTSVALWVGGIALVAIFKLEVDEDGLGRVRPWQAYFGRWLLFVLLGALQAVVCCTGNMIIGIQCAHPWAFYLSAIVASFAFVNVIFALSVAFKHLGKALAFTLIILQVPGSAGMYPIEMMPSFFQAINPWLPFTYSNNALREAVAGLYGNNLAHDLTMLLLFVVPSILVGVTARGHLVNINALFDKRLRETDHLMVSEPVAIEGNRYRLATVIKAMRAPEEYRAEFDKRSAAFEKAYPALKRYGIVALFVVPITLFVLLLVTNAKLQLIACWVISLVLIYAYNIVIEYFHDRIQTRRALTDLSEDELTDVLVDTLRDEVMPYAPVDAIIERRAQRQESGLIERVHERLETVVADAPKFIPIPMREASGEEPSEPKGEDVDADADVVADAGVVADADMVADADADVQETEALDADATEGGDEQ